MSGDDATSDEEVLRRAKRALRSRMRRRLTGVSPTEREVAGLSLASVVASSPLFTEAGVILSFVSLADEIDTRPLHRLARAAGKILGLPRIDAGGLTFRRVDDLAELHERNRFGILEPAAALPEVPLTEAELAFVPGLAYDGSGRRLGRGGGYYDRFLASLPEARRVGLCYEFQLLESVPASAFDLWVAWIATERALVSAGPPRR